MKKYILILTSLLFVALSANADNYYYNSYSSNSDYYNKVNSNTYQSMNNYTTYTVKDRNVYGSDGSSYTRNNNMIYNNQTGATYYNNNGYIQKF